jgi:hypothetical protein
MRAVEDVDAVHLEKACPISGLAQVRRCDPRRPWPVEALSLDADPARIGQRDAHALEVAAIDGDC